MILGAYNWNSLANMHSMSRSSRLASPGSIYLLLFCVLQHIAHATHIEIYSDASCQNKTDGWNGPNGYPDGRCTSLKRDGNFTSFMVTNPDPGCAITIYRIDTTADICSGSSAIGTPSQCYNADFYYYSIDECFTPGGSSLPLSSSTTAAQQTTTVVKTTRASHAHTSTGSASATATAQPDHGTNVGAIAGGVVGGVAGGAILAALGIIAFIRYRRTKRPRTEDRDRGGSAPPPYGGGAVEIAAKESPSRNSGPWGSQRHELGDEAPVELQMNLVHELPSAERGELGSKSPTWTQGSGEAILGRDPKPS